jgi:tRNA G18 (ribose-2'-O)-methylase SpoU
VSKASDCVHESGYFILALYAPEKAVNVGTVLRTAYAFGASAVHIIGGKYYKQSSDTCKAVHKIPVQ